MKSATSDWQPAGFEHYRGRYPSTPSLSLPAFNVTERFCDIWEELGGRHRDARLRELASRLAGTSCVLVRGFLGNVMPGNFVPALRALQRLGVDAFIARNRSDRLVSENGENIAAQIRRRVAPQRKLLLLGHSKGGLEAQWVLAFHPDLAARAWGAVMSQTPRGPSAVLESLFQNRHQESLTGLKRHWAERLQRAGLRTLQVRRGGCELTSEALPAVIAQLDVSLHKLKVFQTASWSSMPTAWLDSFHQRLGEIRPGWAHDGQFYLGDLLWPQIPHVLLPHVDHAQPVMGGLGFDCGRYWLAYLILFLESA